MNYRKILVEAGKKLYSTKLVAGTSGNISLRGEDEDSFYITPSGMDYEKIEEKDIVKIHADGKPYIEGQVPSSEWQMHLEIYKNYPKYNAVVHTHSTFATAFAVAREEIPLISIEMEPFIGGELKVAPFEKAGSMELAKAIIPYLEKPNSCLLANHGVLCCGASMEKAFLSAEYVEDLAKIYYYAKGIGRVYTIND
ncbi:L-fuculose-phosphate aldolase [Peptoniphilus asaccharolyticus DSM 20463]|uniref:L-fuculose-phosphate aldolase n=1 Tax=Peptoniphilus asaccharolyticus DSM 20463 TaxID=573058 RepID=A0A1W1UHR3_PEPAS|nr:class II aldolase/adducin family protein [Peptoniphilus asaccharolyticus]MBL7574700.1 class II aldolase/adducin family protein [Peptoniphilus asaccharolyticus]SMB80294.1 L-fuculose-phosphate aldolase [Peptoniphilus asaccharolyticus DSM 20463]